MTFHLQFSHRFDDGVRVQRDLANVADLGKAVVGAEYIGITSAEMKALLSELKRVVVDKRIERSLAERRHCPGCGSGDG